MSRYAMSLPVLMYHYINDCPNPIAVSRRLFEEQCRVLAENGWRGVGLAEAGAFLEQGEPLPARSFLMTFDDGYLDNYLYAMPIMARYGHKGIMCAVANRIEEGDAPRVGLDDIFAGKAPDMPELNAPVQRDALGFDVRNDIFCNRAEVRAMHRAGVMQVISHSEGHLAAFTGAGYQGFCQPGHQRRTFYTTRYPWLWGMPAFPVKPGLASREFRPSDELLQGVRERVPQEYAAAAEFFARAEAVRELERFVQSLANEGRLGRMETDAEQEERFRAELLGGKARLEALLGEAVHALCWPWGKYCGKAHDLAKGVGHSLFFTTKEGANPPARPEAVCRFKAKAQSGQWLLNRVRLYSRPVLGALYAKIRL